MFKKKVDMALTGFFFGLGFTLAGFLFRLVATVIMQTIFSLFKVGF